MLTEIRRLPAHRLLQSLSFFLPPSRVTYRLVKPWLSKGGLIATPYDGGEVVTRAEWIGAPAMREFFGGAAACNPELRHLERAWPAVAKRPGCLVDVGAANGSYVLWMRHRSDKPIVAFEPSPLTFECLAATVARNQLRDVTVRQVACDAKGGGAVRLQLGANSVVTPDGAAEVRTVRLDDELPTPVALLKVDVEGMEVDVLRGAAGIIERDHPALWIEGHPTMIGSFGHSIDELYQMLGGCGYQVETFMSDPAFGHHEVVGCQWAKIRSAPPAQIFLLAL
jgi:FkbM family methyltransferase